MMDVKIDGIDKVLAALHPKQVKHATSVALNNAAFAARKDLHRTMNTYFDNPKKSFVGSAFKVVKATKKDLNANVYLRDDILGKGGTHEGVLGHHFVGGARPLKRFELALIRNGYMSNNQIAVKAKEFKGRMTPAFFARLMSYLQLHYKAGYSANMKAKAKGKIEKRGRTKKGYATIGGKAYFIITNRSLPHTKQFKQPGIYQKRGIHGVDVEPVIVFVKKARYKKRFDLKEIVSKSVREHYPKAFEKAWQHAIATAK